MSAAMKLMGIWKQLSAISPEGRGNQNRKQYPDECRRLYFASKNSTQTSPGIIIYWRSSVNWEGVVKTTEI